MTERDDMTLRGGMMTEYRDNEAKIATRREALSKSYQCGEVTIDSEQVFTPPSEAHRRDGERIPRQSIDIAAVATLLDELKALNARQAELHPKLEVIGFLQKGAH